MALANNTLLGQHWLKDPAILARIAEAAEITEHDTVLEVGPGLGTLTSRLLARAERVVAVEFDAELAKKLPGQFPGKNLEVVSADILTFNPETLPKGYKVVANVPYYITTKIIKHFLEGPNQPAGMTLLVQEEVADKYASAAGNYTEQALLLQCDYNVQSCIRVPKMYFTPPPKVDSKVLVCKKRNVSKIADIDQAAFKRVVRAGFAAPRKKLRSSLAAGLHMSSADVDAWCAKSGVDAEKRAQDLNIDEWKALAS